MNAIENIESFTRAINDNSLVLAYFSGHYCSVCHAVKPQIKALLTGFYPDVLFIEIQIEELPELAARYSVFTIPAVLFFVEGKEYIREVRMIDILLLNQKLDKIISLYQS